MKAVLLMDSRVVLKEGKYVMFVKVYEVERSQRYPDGIKAKFVLQDLEFGLARLLVDNHEPFGFHMHTMLPHQKDHRVELDVRDYKAALRLFERAVERIVKDEK